MNVADSDEGTHAGPDAEPQRLYETIGRVTAEGVLLDHYLKVLLVVIDFSMTLANYANAASTQQLVQLCRLAISSSKAPADVTYNVNQLLDRADSLRNARNEVVHSLWQQAPDETAPTQAGLLGLRPTRNKIGLKAVSTDSLAAMREIAASTYELRDEIFVASYNIGVTRAGNPAAQIELSPTIVNPHGTTQSGRSTSATAS